jgi:hypothetical protein
MKLSLIRPILIALAALLVGAVLGMWLNRSVSRSDVAGSPAAGLRQLDGRINAFRPRPGASAPSTAPASIRWASLSDDDYLKYLTELKRIGCPLRTLKDIISKKAREGTTGFYDSVNRVRVINDSVSGRVVIVITGVP